MVDGGRTLNGAKIRDALDEPLGLLDKEVTFCRLTTGPLSRLECGILRANVNLSGQLVLSLGGCSTLQNFGGDKNITFFSASSECGTANIVGGEKGAGIASLHSTVDAPPPLGGITGFNNQHYSGEQKTLSQQGLTVTGESVVLR